MAMNRPPDKKAGTTSAIIVPETEQKPVTIALHETQSKLSEGSRHFPK
jgi:hypothetical protein